MKNRSSDQVAVLLALHDVAAVLDEHAGHRVDDAGPVGADEREDVRRRPTGGHLGHGAVTGELYSRAHRCVNRDTYCHTQHKVRYRQRMSQRLPAGGRPVGRPGADASWASWRGWARPGSRRSPRELGVHKSTAFRLVATLESHGMVEQNEDRGKYRLGVGVLRLAGATTARLDVVQEARPICRKLAADSGETVNIAVLSDRSALYLDQVAGQSALQSHNWVGQHIPLHATSNGKVLLSGLSSRRGRQPAAAAAVVHRGDRHHQGEAAPRAGRGARAGLRRRGRRARDRADRDRGADPQRARRRDRLAERLRADVPARRGSGSRSWSPVVLDAADEVSRRLGHGSAVESLTGSARPSRNCCCVQHIELRHAQLNRTDRTHACRSCTSRDGGRALVGASAARSAARRTASLVAEVDEAGPEDTHAAIARRPRGLRRRAPGPAGSALERGALLHRVADLLSRDKAEVARAESLDTGKRLVESEYDVDDVVGVFRHYGNVAAEDAGRIVDTGQPDVRQPRRARADRRLRPDHAVELPAAADRLEGRALPRRGQHVRAQAQRADPAHRDPADGPARGGRRARRASANLVLGAGPAPAHRSARTRASTWCRSPAAWRPASGSWPRRPRTVKKVALELGGKNPNVVFADADLDDRARLRADRGLPALRAGLLGRRPAGRRGVASTTSSSTSWSRGPSGSGSAGRSTTTPRPGR